MKKNIKKWKNENETIMLSIAKWKKQAVTIKIFQKSPQIWFIFGHFLRFQKMFPKTHFYLQHNYKTQKKLLLNMVRNIQITQNAFLETFGNKKKRIFNF